MAAIGLVGLHGYDHHQWRLSFYRRL